jgi:hypothetical protein
MSEERQSRLDFSKCQDLTVEACCASKLTISCIGWETKKGKVEGTKKQFLSPRKHMHIPKRVRNLDNFKRILYTELLSNIMIKANSLLSRK